MKKSRDRKSKKSVLVQKPRTLQLFFLMMDERTTPDQPLILGFKSRQERTAFIKRVLSKNPRFYHAIALDAPLIEFEQSHEGRL